MHGIILAAGRGSRLGNHTADKPKCMTELHGVPLLTWQCQALAAATTDITVITGYYSTEIPHVHTLHHSRWNETNMVGTLQCAAKILQKHPCIVSYSDIVYPAQVAQQLAETPGDIVISYDPNWYQLWSKRFDHPLEDAETFATNPAGQLTDIGRRTTDLAEINGQYMGLLKITPQGWAHIQAHFTAIGQAQVDQLDMTSLLQALIQNGISIHTTPITTPWCEIDDPSDLAVAHQIIQAPHK